MQDKNLNQIKHKINDTSKKDEKATTNSGPPDNEDVVKKAYLYTKLTEKRVIYHK